jgi:uncharacterized GH25 family protein
MATRLILILFFSAASFRASAQEVWLESPKFYYNNGDTMDVSLMEGVDFIGSAWSARQTDAGSNPIETGTIKIKIFDAAGVGSKSQPAINGRNRINIVARLHGTYMIVSETPTGFREMDAEKFNAYLREAALDDAFYGRQKTNSLDKNGKESFVHFAKLLLQAGGRTDDIYKKESRVPIEIIPQQNPFELKVGSRVQFKVLYEGKPLFGARVKVWNRHNNRTSVQNIFTEQNGMVETHISNPGAWMVSVVKMIPSKDPGAEWQSFKGSLVFGIK